MTKKDDGFTVRLPVALVTAMTDRNHKDARVIVATLAKEHGTRCLCRPSYGTPADTVRDG